MTIHSHPSEATLLAYAAGTLPQGASFAVAAHLGFCDACEAPIATWEMAGGSMLNAMPEAPLSEDAFARTLARAQRHAESEKLRVPLFRPPGIEIPAALDGVSIKRRRWVAPGIWRADIAAGGGAKSQTYVIRLGPGKKIPLHGHDGPEVICVLKGSFIDAGGRYEAGDFVEVDEATDHQPVAGLGGECICIIAAEGAPRFRGALGWLLGFFAR
jgi:putative transcriptional regulator